MTSERSGDRDLRRPLIELAGERVRVMLGCYPHVQVGDPETYTSALVSVLVRYPEEVIVRVTEPSGGLPSRLKWPPTVAELVEACDELMAPIERDRRRQAAIDETLLRRHDSAFDYPRLCGPSGSGWSAANEELRGKLLDLKRRVFALRSAGKGDEAQPLADEYNRLRPLLDKAPDGGLGEDGEYAAFLSGARRNADGTHGTREQRTRHIGEVLRKHGWFDLAKKFSGP